MLFICPLSSFPEVLFMGSYGLAVFHRIIGASLYCGAADLTGCFCSFI
ncbi:hypothetical protein [Bartonella apihabitans]